MCWMIAASLFYGGAGTLGTAPATADSGPAGDHTQESPSKVGPAPGARLRPSPAAATPAVPGDQIPGEGEEDPGWPWPWPPCIRRTDDGVANLPRTRLGRTAPPKSAVGGGGGGGGGIAVTIPSPTVPGQPGEPTPVLAGGGSHEPPPAREPPTIEMPPIIGAPPVLEAPLRPVGAPGANGPAVETGSGGRPAPAKEPATVRQRPPASVGNATEAPASSRVGYPEYLREAKTGEVAALALPGVAGLLALTALGGVVGYRQARAGHFVRVAGTARFLQ